MTYVRLYVKKCLSTEKDRLISMLEHISKKKKSLIIDHWIMAMR